LSNSGSTSADRAFLLSVFLHVASGYLKAY